MIRPLDNLSAEIECVWLVGWKAMVDTTSLEHTIWSLNYFNFWIFFLTLVMLFIS